MNVVVSNNMIDYSGFKKVKTLEEVCTLVSQGTHIDYLVFHKTNEKVDDKVKHLTVLKDIVGKLIYIRDKDVYEVAVYMVVTGAGGLYFDDEFYLQGSNELNSLLGDMSGATTQLASLGDVNIVEDFFTRYVRDGGRDLNKAYLSLVKDAVSGMITQYEAKSLELVQLSETATELFSNSMKVLSGVEEEKLNLKKSIARLEEVKDNLAFSASSAGSVFYFPSVRYMKERKILRIKEWGNCNYLTSFLLGFKIYCEEKKFLRPRLIFIYSVGSEYEERYKDFNWVTQASAKRTETYDSDILFMNYPNEESFLRILDDKDYDFFIVVDREKFSGRHLLDTGNKSPMCYASCGESILKQKKVQYETAFTNRAVEGTMFQLAEDPNYPSDVEHRVFYYLQEYAVEYEALLNYKGTMKKRG